MFDLVFDQYKKTFPTPVPGLPELIFNEGFCAFQSYCSQVGSPLPSSAPATVEYKSNNMLFVIYKLIEFSNGDGTADGAIYLGLEMHNDVLKHKVR